MGRAEIVVNKQARGHEPGNHTVYIYQGAMTKGKRVVGENTKGGSKPETQQEDQT